MSAIDCGAAREAIPDLVHGSLAEDVAGNLLAHTASCEACASELALVRMLFETRAQPHFELEGNIRRGVAFHRQTLHRPWWAATAAAVAALALGIGMSSEEGPIGAPGFATEVGESWPWVLEGELGLDAPVLDELSDEVLETLLADLAQADGGS